MKLLYLEWLDSHAARGWKTFEELKEDDEPLLCQTVGWLLAESKSAVVIVSSKAGGGDTGSTEVGSGCSTIPKVAITKRLEIRSKKIGLGR